MITTRIHDSLLDIPEAQWDALHDGRNPFVAHAFLDGMERQGVIDPRLGWTPWHLGLWEGDALVAAALAPWCAEEAEAVRKYAATLASHSPFRE